MKCSSYYHAEHGRIAILMAYADDVLLAGYYEEKVKGMINNQLERYQGQDLNMTDKPIGLALMVTDGSFKLDQTPYTEIMSLKSWVLSIGARFPHHSTWG